MANVAAMGFGDKNALVVAAYIVALNMVCRSPKTT
jgi:hypothetical protein